MAGTGPAINSHMNKRPLLLLIFGLLVTLISCGKGSHDQSAFKVKTSYLATYESLDGPRGIEETKRRYVKNLSTDQQFDGQALRNQIDSFNADTIAAADPIDAFIGKLPAEYRQHFTLVHRSYSLQRGTPMSPRVIMFGPSAQVIMTFNDEKMAGGKSIEVIEWKAKEKRWNFLELTFNQENKIQVEENPNKCVMCHSGTPKAIDISQASHYKKALKPIFPQYPFWPGFYGSVNDIVAVDAPGSKDTVMRSMAPTMAHIKSLTFSDTEELFRLRKMLDENPKYEDVIKNEMEVHAKYFKPFMDSIKGRERYRHLMTLKDLYLNKKESVPEHLKSAPYRRKFDMDYGHYLFRPNFYFSTLLTFYHSQYVASEIEQFPEYNKMKYSLLARKYNCSNVKVDNLKVSDLDPSFNLVYPDIADKKSREEQYLLAYQYNVYRAKNGGPAALPLHTWNLESNEEIASYHYGNVFSDLNELVLWRLAKAALPQIQDSMGRSAAQDRHYILPGSNFLRDVLEKTADGFVSKMTNKEMAFATANSPFYGRNILIKAQPVSFICDKYILPKVKAELLELQKTQLPHEVYSLDKRLLDLDNLAGENALGTSMVRQGCESCHKSEESKISPKLNVDWYSDTYHEDLHGVKNELKLGDSVLEVISSETLPVPYGRQMPFARRPMDEFALKCEEMIVTNSMRSSVALKAKVFQCDPADANSMACRCEKMSKLKSKIYREFYPRIP